ncbi:CLC voltage-gated chloride channel, partial [Aureobasidium sp. EXF-3399]
MPKPVSSYAYDADAYDPDSTPPTPRSSRGSTLRRHGRRLGSDWDLKSRLPSRLILDEHTSLLDNPDGRLSYRAVASAPQSPKKTFKRRNSAPIGERRSGTLSSRVAKAFGAEASRVEEDHDDEDDDQQKLSESIYYDDRVWYDQYTSTDWVQDSISDAFRLKELRSRKGFRGRAEALFDSAQGWILVAVIGCVTAGIAYIVDVSESVIFDLKTGYCSHTWYYGKRSCCEGASTCDAWSRWSIPLTPGPDENGWFDYAAFVFWVIALSLAACLVTLQTKTVISSAVSLSTLDENLAAHAPTTAEARKDSSGSPTRRFAEAAQKPPMVYYPAAGSGVAEVKVILSGFIIRGYLGLRTLMFKTLGLILSVASGLSLGKEGPFVHIATCVGNVACRMFEKYHVNDAKRREILSASAASGVAVAFGSPIGGVLFSLEEVSYYFPPKTLFRTFFCCIAAALSLKFLNPYGTNKIVLFEVRYLTDWQFFEMAIFILLGVLGGTLGALFIKASRLWANTFRRIPSIKRYPVLEVFLVALVTGLVSFWNRYTRIPVSELLFELASPCNSFSSSGYGLCPTEENIPNIIGYLCIAFVIKSALTVVTFGVKLPAGIYVPSMVVGGLLGRIVGHSVQLITLRYPSLEIFGNCPANGNPESCVVPGVYALVAAGATMTGVTRLSVTLAVILFELTGSLEHVLPFSIGVLVSKWTADALEPLSIYDLLTDMNSYPYLDAKSHPPFLGDLGDITHAPNPKRLIDISASPFIPSSQLRTKLEYMHMAGELDGGLPILDNGVLMGIIPGPDLEFALDHLQQDGHDSEAAMCYLGRPLRDAGLDTSLLSSSAEFGARRGSMLGDDEFDFSSCVDPSPMALDIRSPLELVYELFSKLGLRYLCVLDGGKFAGLVHKKAFVRYVKELEHAERKGEEH